MPAVASEADCYVVRAMGEAPERAQALRVSSSCCSVNMAPRLAPAVGPAAFPMRDRVETQTIGPFQLFMGVLMQETRAIARYEAFDEFYFAHHDRLKRACLLLTGNPTDAEDLAQEAMARILERWYRVSAMEDSEGYLFRTALNLHKNALKRVSVVARRHLVAEGDTTDRPTERVLDIRRAVSSLPIAQRQALVLVEWLGYSVEEAASLVGIKAVSVRGRLHRARQSLRREFGGADD